MDLAELEQTVRSQISALEAKESRLKGWLQSLDQIESRVGPSEEFELSLQLQKLIDRLPVDSSVNHFILNRLPNINSKELFEERLSSLRERLSIQPIKFNWKRSTSSK